MGLFGVHPKNALPILALACLDRLNCHKKCHMRGRTSKVVNLVNLDEEGEANVVSERLKARISNGTKPSVASS